MKKKERLESIGDVIVREMGYDFLKKILIGIAVLAVLALTIWLAGCATTAPAIRAATAEEVTQYGLKAGAHRYEYPDAVVFVQSETTLHPDVVWDGRPFNISSDTENRREGNLIRSVETSSSCVPGTNRCSVTVQKSLIVMRSNPVKVESLLHSTVTSEVSTADGARVLMLHPTETALRALVLKAIELRDNPPHPGNDCKRTRLTADFIGKIHAPFERRAAEILAEDGYIPIHGVMEAEIQLADYEMSERGCMASKEDAIAAAIKGSSLIAEILGSVWADPNL